MRYARRKVGRPCQDCGWRKPVRVITFWATGFRYRVCADCEKCYRPVICWPVREETQ